MVLTRQQKLMDACVHNNLLYLEGVFKKLQKDKELVKKAVREKEDGLTLLLTACANGHLRVVRYLVNVCGADVDLVADSSANNDNMQGMSPLLCAVISGDFRIVKFLISAGANVNTTTHPRWTPLRAATYCGHIEILSLLLDKDADLWLATLHGEHHLLRRGSSEYWAVENVMVQRAVIFDHDFYKFRAIMYLSSIATVGPGHFENIANTTINRFKRDIDRDVDNLLEEFERVDMLLEYIVCESGKNERYIFDQMRFPLGLLDQIWRVKAALPEDKLQDCLGRYADLVHLERQRQGKKTMIHCLCCVQSTVHPPSDFVKFLVEMGADVDARDVLGNTPLHIAARYQPLDTELVDSLVQHGAHIDLANIINKTAMDLLPKDGIPVCSLTNPVPHQTLQCLAATAVCRYTQIPYYNMNITERAREIIEQHSYMYVAMLSAKKNK